MRLKQRTGASTSHRLVLRLPDTAPGLSRWLRGRLERASSRHALRGGRGPRATHVVTHCEGWVGVPGTTSQRHAKRAG